jgi:hypothetical protein
MPEQIPETIPAEDAWAYTPEIIERLRRAQTQRGYVLGPDDLEKIAAEMEAAHQAGREYRLSEAELAAMEAKHLAARDGVAAHAKANEHEFGAPSTSGR